MLDHMAKAHGGFRVKIAGIPTVNRCAGEVAFGRVSKFDFYIELGWRDFDERHVPHRMYHKAARRCYTRFPSLGYGIEV